MKKTAVIGSQNFNEYQLLKNTLDQYPIKLVVSGGAKGADFLAVKYAKEHAIPYEVIRPDYKKYPGRYAPIKRNELIVLASEMVIAFWDGKSPGTKSAIDFAKKHHRRLRIINFTPKPTLTKNFKPSVGS